METLASIRSMIYTSLAQGFRHPSPASFASLINGLLAAADGSTEAKTLGWYRAKVTDTETWQELSLTYNRLFFGPGRPVAPPYESVYRDRCGLVMGEPAARVAQLYAEEGLSLSAESKELPDQLSVELEYMAYLTISEAEAWQKGDTEKARNYLSKEVAFLTEHLGRWISLFCNQIEAGTDHPFYTSLARLTRSYIEGDLSQAQQWLHGQPQGGDERTDDNKARLLFPNIRITVDQQVCTVCGTCADVCRPGALRLSADTRNVGLLYDRALCNGCRACQRYCPEKGITVQRLTPLPHPLQSEPRRLMHSPRLTCTGCGQPYVTEAWLQRILKQINSQDISFEQILRLCPACKARRTELSSDYPHLFFDGQHKSHV
ncbi:MAG: molecular chaperone TorD family protein [Anaerolineae bacterium]